MNLISSPNHSLVRFIALLLVISALLVFAGSCTVSPVRRYSSLANQGILPLSTNNPFLGSNLYIADEAQKSAVLYNFLENRGGPTAMELDEEGEAPKMLLYYPGKKEVFSAELSVSPHTYEWIVRGPYQIERKDYRELAGTLAGMNGDPVFQIAGVTHRFGRRQFGETNASEVALLPPTPPRPTPTPKPKPRKKLTAEAPLITVGGSVVAAATPFRPLNSDQQALLMAKGLAQRADNGDLIHSVKREDETIAAIARWYTGDEASASKLAEENGLASGAAPAKGSKIRIPLDHVKNFNQMPGDYK